MITSLRMLQLHIFQTCISTLYPKVLRSLRVRNFQLRHFHQTSHVTLRNEAWKKSRKSWALARCDPAGYSNAWDDRPWFSEKRWILGMWKTCLWNVDHFSERDEWCLSIYCTFAIITIYHSILYSDIFILIYYVVHIVMWIDILLWFYETVDMQYESPQCEFPPHHSKPFLPTLWGYDVCRKIRQHYEESRTVAWRISSKDIGPSIQSLSPEPIPKDRNNCF